MFNRYRSFSEFLTSSSFKVLSPAFKYQQPLYLSRYQSLKSLPTSNLSYIPIYSFSSSKFSDLALLGDKISQEEIQLMENYSTKTFQNDRLTSKEIQSISSILHQLGLAHQEARNYKKALQYLSERESLFQKFGIKDTLDVAQNHYDMACILWDLCEWSEIENHSKEVDRICDLHEDKKEARSLKIQNWHSFSAMKKPDETFEFYKSILKNIDEIMKPALVDVYQGIGSIYSSKGDVENAVESWDKGLETAISCHGENSQAAYKFLDSLASLLCSKDQYLRAEPYAQRGLQVALRIFPKDSEELALSYLQLVTIYRGKRDYAKALDFYHSAVKIFEKKPDEDSLMNLYTSYFQIGVLYKLVENHEEASNFFNKADAALIKFNREPNSSIVIVFSRWAKQLYRQKMVAESKEYYRKIIDVAKSSDKSSVVLAYVALGKIALDERNLSEALELFKESEKWLKPDDSFNFRIVNLYLASAYLRCKNYEESLKCSQKVIQSCEDVIKASLISTGEIFGDRQLLKEALESYQVAAKCKEEDLEIGDLKVERVLSRVQQIREKVKDTANQ